MNKYKVKWQFLFLCDLFIVSKEIYFMISNVSFGAKYNTREVAMIAGGAPVSKEMLSNITGKPKDTFYSINAGMLGACSGYVADKFVEQHPKLSPIQKISEIIKSKISLMPQEKKDFDEISRLMQKKALLVDTFCAENGESIEIDDFSIPFLS